ncbi:MAG: DUF4097 family beta strand repeat-containing protein [Acidobacteriota bacterium]
MLKRIATFLLGIALVSLGILFFIAPERTFLVQTLLRYWPAFLVLAGLVRVGGHLLDRQPRSPMGGMLLVAIGGILLSANHRGETRILEIAGQYWFWLLLAFVAARVMRQYTHRSSDGSPPRAFTPASVVVMLAISGTGLGAHWLSGHGQNLAHLRLPFRFNNVRAICDNEYSIADESAKTFSLPAKARLVFDGFEGDIDVHSGQSAVPSARVVRRLRSSSEAEAQTAAKKIILEIKSQGDARIFSILSDGVETDYTATLTIELPAGAAAGVDASAVMGQLTLSGLRGEHSLRNVESATISDNDGGVSVSGARSVRFERIRGKVSIEKATREVALRDISGAAVVRISGGTAKLERIDGQVELEGHNSRIEVREIGQRIDAAPVMVELKNLTDSRLVLARVKGNINVTGSRTGVEASNITGDLSVRSSGVRVKAAGVSGALKLVVEDGSVDAADLQGPAEIEATRDVAVRNFQNEMRVSSRLGAINLVLDRQIAGDLHAMSEHGHVRLTLPQDSRFRLDARTSFGKLKLRGFEQLNLPRGPRNTSISYSADGDAPLVDLRSTNGDIVISSSASGLASRDRRASN